MDIDYCTRTGSVTRVGVMTFRWGGAAEEEAIKLAMEYMSADEYMLVDAYDNGFEVVFDNGYLP